MEKHISKADFHYIGLSHNMHLKVSTCVDLVGECYYYSPYHIIIINIIIIIIIIMNTITIILIWPWVLLVLVVTPQNNKRQNTLNVILTAKVNKCHSNR